MRVPRIRDAGARDAHLLRVATAIERALERTPADLVVLPELSAIEYGREAFEQLAALSEPEDGPSHRTFAALAARRRVHVVYGFARRTADGYRISQGAVAPDGRLLGCYDKLHLAQYGACMEKDFFEPGRSLVVFQVGGMRAAPIICYDIRFPELARTLCRRHGVELLLHCGAYYRDASYASWPHFVVARAMENQIYVLSLNRAGTRYGGSMFCPPWVDDARPMVRLAGEEALRVFEVDPELITGTRAQYSFLADARNDYAKLRLNPPRRPSPDR